MPRILVVEDEIGIQKLLQYDLKSIGFEVDVASSGLEALELFESSDYDVVLLDWMLPGISGIDLLKRFRTQNMNSVIMMVSAKSEEEDVVEALNYGADDYVFKPFSPRILTARIKAHLRRMEPEETNVIKMSGVVLDYNMMEVMSDGVIIPTTKTEFDLLAYLMCNPNKVLSRDDILIKIWNFDYDGDTRIVDVHIYKLRTKLKDSGLNIESVRGVGYIVKTK